MKNLKIILGLGAAALLYVGYKQSQEDAIGKNSSNQDTSEIDSLNAEISVLMLELETQQAELLALQQSIVDNTYNPDDETPPIDPHIEEIELLAIEIQEKQDLLDQYIIELDNLGIDVEYYNNLAESKQTQINILTDNNTELTNNYAVLLEQKTALESLQQDTSDDYDTAIAERNTERVRLYGEDMLEGGGDGGLVEDHGVLEQDKADLDGLYLQESTQWGVDKDLLDADILSLEAQMLSNTAEWDLDEQGYTGQISDRDVIINGLNIDLTNSGNALTTATSSWDAERSVLEQNATDQYGLGLAAGDDGVYQSDVESVEDEFAIAQTGWDSDKAILEQNAIDQYNEGIVLGEGNIQSDFDIATQEWATQKTALEQNATDQYDLGLAAGDDGVYQSDVESVEDEFAIAQTGWDNERILLNGEIGAQTALVAGYLSAYNNMTQDYNNMVVAKNTAVSIADDLTEVNEGLDIEIANLISQLTAKEIELTNAGNELATAQESLQARQSELDELNLEYTNATSDWNTEILELNAYAEAQYDAGIAYEQADDNTPGVV